MNKREIIEEFLKFLKEEEIFLSHIDWFLDEGEQIGVINYFLLADKQLKDSNE